MGRWGSKRGPAEPAVAPEESWAPSREEGAEEQQESPAPSREEGAEEQAEDAREATCCEVEERSAPSTCELEAAGASPPPAERGGRLLPNGQAWFPVMTAEELAAIAVPASAPREQLRSALARHGACLLTGVLSPDECRRLEGLWQADLLGLLDERGGGWLPEEASVLEALKRDGASAWPSSWCRDVGSKGCASRRGLPHGSFAWAARLHPAVRAAFADVYGTPEAELAVGLDVVFWSAADAPGAESNLEWMHCDQNHQTGMTWPCVQGVLYVWPSDGERASTTVVWPGSHREVYGRIMQDDFARNRGRSTAGRGQSVRLSSLADASLRAGLTAEAVAAGRRVPCPAGSLLLWDSRTIHQGWAGGPRLAQPVCWEPRSRREQDPAALRRKIFMSAAGVPSSHSAAEGRVHGMAPRQPPSAAWGGALRPQLAPPWGVAGERLGEWQDLQRQLWGGSGDPRKNANSGDAALLSGLLKREVLDAL